MGVGAASLVSLQSCELSRRGLATPTKGSFLEDLCGPCFSGALGIPAVM